MLLSNKHLTPVLGLDIHIVIIPPGVPVPLPHPFIGLVIDPADYIPFIGATVKINGLPRGNSGTTGMLGIFVHIPMGGPFAMAPMIGHDSVNFFGSQKTLAEDMLLTPAGHMIMTCNDIGMPLTFSPGKKMKPIPSMYLPTSFSIPIPLGKPVMVGGPYVPDLMGILKAMVMSYSFGAAFKGLGKLGSKGLKALNNALPANKFTKGLKKSMCKMGFEPVDLVDGRMVYDGTDFELPGPIPVEWERNWYSDSSYTGPLGHGFHHSYDLKLERCLDENVIMLILADGRPAAFELLLSEGSTFYNRSEQLTLSCIDRETYSVFDHKQRLEYRFEHIGEEVFKPVYCQNEDGQAIQFNYTSGGELNQLIDTAGRVIDLELDEEQRITKISASHRGQSRTLVNYQYNDVGDLIGITDAMGKTTHMRYRNHLMVEKTDRNGQTFYWKYDGPSTGARCIHTWGDGGLLEGTIEYRKGHNVVTNSLGHQTTYHYDENNLCTQVSDAMGGHVFHRYTDFMEPYRDIDEEGNITGYTYDERGNLESVTLPDGSTQVYQYDEQDRLIFSKTPVGATTVRVFEDHRLLSIVDADKSVTSFEYNEQGRVASIRNDQGHVTKFTYDEDHNLEGLELSNGQRSSWSHDAWGQVITSQQGGNKAQQFEYDHLGRILRLQQSDSNVLQLKYNAYDEVIELRDKKQHVKFSYTPLGSLEVREEHGRKVHFTYDTEEQLHGITNEQGEFYHFRRDKNGSIIEESGFDGLTRYYERNRAGKVIKVERPENRFTEYEYDLNGRIVRAEYDDGSWEAYTYNRDGQLIEAVNPNSKVTLIREDSGRVVKEIQDGHEVASSYDSIGRRVGVVSSLGAAISIERDELGQVTELKAQSNKSKVWEAQYSYNSLGLETERSLNGGVKVTQRYDDAGRPVEQQVRSSEQLKRHRHYQWDVNDRLKEMVDALTNGKVSYSHDTFGNLASAQYESGQYDYKLPDEVGNLYRSKDRKDREYGRGGQLLKDKDWHYRYDEEGNLIEKRGVGGCWEYTWYGNGMLQRVSRPDGQELSFEYDALGRRTAKCYKNKLTRFVWDGNVPLHEWEYDLEDRPKEVVDELGMLVKDKEEPVQNLLTWVFDEGTFRPAAKITEEESYSIVTDYLGTPVEMYNSAGVKTWEAEYDIYGKVRNLKVGSLSDCPFRYQGQYEDEESGLYYNRFRYYSPDEGVYISQDPIGLDSDIYNFYSYVGDINAILDPLGLVRRRKNGQYAKKPGPKPKPSGHGNSASSTKPNILYAMYDEDGEFQKWGITQESDPYKRYGNTLPEGNTLEIVDKGSRKTMLALERELTETNPGPLNKESWAGKRKGDTDISNRAKKALKSCN